MRDEAYERWHAAQRAAMNAVSCPRCKAPAGQPCDWGVTNSGDVHTPRLRKAAKKAG